MSDPTSFLSAGLLVATAGATAVAWAQAIASDRARRDSEKAKDAALSAWRDASDALVRANQVTDMTLRGSFAFALQDLGSALLAARATGGDDAYTLSLVLERTPDIAEKSFGVGDASTDEILGWVTRYSRGVDIGAPIDVDKFMAANALVSERVRLWFRDPQSAIEMVKRDPRVTKPE